MKNSKQYRAMMVSAIKASKDERCDGAGIRYIQDASGVSHGDAASLWFSYVVPRLPLSGVGSVNGLYRYFVETSGEIGKYTINRADRSIVVFGKPAMLFSH